MTLHTAHTGEDAVAPVAAPSPHLTLPLFGEPVSPAGSPCTCPCGFCAGQAAGGHGRCPYNCLRPRAAVTVAPHARRLPPSTATVVGVVALVLLVAGLTEVGALGVVAARSQGQPVAWDFASSTAHVVGEGRR